MSRRRVPLPWSRERHTTGNDDVWLRQTGLVAVAMVGVWVVSVRLGESPGGSSVAVSAVAVVAIAALGVGLILATSSDSDD